jgi:Protein of unknown function (DUF1203)
MLCSGHPAWVGYGRNAAADSRQRRASGSDILGFMTPSTTVAFRVTPIPAAALDAVRRSGIDASGHPVEYLVAEGGEPLRCCLRDARAGEPAILFGYAPPLPAASPYREVGAVFAHAETCAGPAWNGYPPDWRGRPQVLRSYDRRGRIHWTTRVHDGADPESVIADMLGDPEVVQVHSRNVAWGCYMFAVTRD